jgi:hypothetical protein
MMKALVAVGLLDLAAFSQARPAPMQNKVGH